ncbi:MAG: filamentous hemagglutinin N-terminal domain-containing protein [Cyanobacteria bacterium P01_F01_bin.143]
MKQLSSLLLSLGYCTLSQGIFLNSVTAQVFPDGTTSTTVNVDGNDFSIGQGDRAGGNLFHSFSNFSVPTDGSAFFNNSADVVNIFSRVTGGNISNIDGVLGANGTANLFLINPAGIIFGEGARLDIGGSFFGSTADSIIFPDGEFSTTDLANPPLITINAPIGLSFRDNPGDIINRSIIDDFGLRVPSGESLTLVGGDITFDDGDATARSGKIELGGLSSAGIVIFDGNANLSFPENGVRANITLGNSSDIDATGNGSGSIIINARNFNLEAGEVGSSRLRISVTSNSITPDTQTGEILVNASEKITIDDRSLINAEVRANITANAGTITLSANTIEITGRSNIIGNTRGQGNAGLISIIAKDSVIISDV